MAHHNQNTSHPVPDRATPASGSAAKQAGHPAAKLLTVLGVILLLLGLIAASVHFTSIKGFYPDSSHDVSKGKEYYLIADKEALKASQCSFESDGKPEDSIPSNIDNLIKKDNSVTDISPLLTSSKGVFAKASFDRDIKGANIRCDKGKNYISTMNPTAMTVLRWGAPLAIVVGLIVIALGLSGRRWK